MHATALNRADLLQSRAVPSPGDAARRAGHGVRGRGARRGSRAVRFRRETGSWGWFPGRRGPSSSHPRARGPAHARGLDFPDAAAIPRRTSPPSTRWCSRAAWRRGDGAHPRGGQRRGLRGGAALPGHGRDPRGHGRNAAKLERAAAWCPFTGAVRAHAPLRRAGAGGHRRRAEWTSRWTSWAAIGCRRRWRLLAPPRAGDAGGTVAGVRRRSDLGLVLRGAARHRHRAARRPLEEKMALARSRGAPRAAAVRAGTLPAGRRRVLPVERVEEAFEALVADRNVGKIVLAWSGR